MMIQQLEQCASTASPPPLLPLGYVHLAFFIDTRCTLSEHEWAVKQLLYIRTLGIAHILPMMQSLAIKRRTRQCHIESRRRRAEVFEF